MQHSTLLELSLSYLNRTSVLCSLLTVMSLVGCSEERKIDKVETFQVTGKILRDGQPVKMPEQAFVRAVLKGETRMAEGKPVSTAGATADPDGTFSLSTYEKGDGIAPGEYALLFKVSQRNLMSGQAGPDKLNGKYYDIENPLISITVTGDETESLNLGTIELTSD